MNIHISKWLGLTIAAVAAFILIAVYQAGGGDPTAQASPTAQPTVEQIPTAEPTERPTPVPTLRPTPVPTVVSQSGYPWLSFLTHTMDFDQQFITNLGAFTDALDIYDVDTALSVGLDIWLDWQGEVSWLQSIEPQACYATLYDESLNLAMAEEAAFDKGTDALISLDTAELDQAITMMDTANTQIDVVTAALDGVTC